jgi:hypothetical protein
MPEAAEAGRRRVRRRGGINLHALRLRRERKTSQEGGEAVGRGAPRTRGASCLEAALVSFGVGGVWPRRAKARNKTLNIGKGLSGTVAKMNWTLLEAEHVEV